MNDERSAEFDGRGGDAPLSLSAAFDLLADEHRRDLLSHLADRNGPVPFSELVRAVIRGSTDATGDATNTDFLGEEYRRITLAVQSEHLPLLERHGVIDYDRELQLIELSADIGPLDGLLDMVRRSGGRGRS